MSPYKHFLAPLSIDDNGCLVLWVLNDQGHHNHKCLLALMSAVWAMAPCAWVLIAPYECSWGLMNAQGCPRALISAHEWSLHHTLGAHKHSWVCKSTHELSFVAMSTRSMAPLHQQHSWEVMSIYELGAMVPLPLIVPWHHTYQCSQVLMNVHCYSWGLLNIPEWSWVFKFLIQ